MTKDEILNLPEDEDELWEMVENNANLSLAIGRIIEVNSLYFCCMARLADECRAKVNRESYREATKNLYYFHLKKERDIAPYVSWIFFLTPEQILKCCLLAAKE